MENSEDGLMARKIENSEEIVIDAQIWAKLDEVTNFQRDARDAIEIEDLAEFTRVRTKGPDHGWRHRQWQHQQGQQNQARVAATKHKFEATSISEYAHDDSDQAEAPICDLHDTDRRKWIREEAVVDSGTVECVTSRERVAHLMVEETPESRRGETWT